MTSRARRAYTAMEPVHGMIYFVPEGAAHFAELGLQGPLDGYFASRVAPLGAVGPEVVAATFYNFNPALIATAIPSAWEKVTPARVLEARLQAVDTSLRRLLPDDVGTPEMADAAATARRATEACTVHGRPLYAGYAGLPWPDEAHLQLWHALTLLREFRGDGHVACLLTHGLDPVEALVTHAASGAVSRKVLQVTRAWSDDDWAAAEDRLRSRGWLDADGKATANGAAARMSIEDGTDELAEAPYAALAEADAERMIATVGSYTKKLIDGGAFSRRPRA